MSTLHFPHNASSEDAVAYRENVAEHFGLRPDADPELVFWRARALERAQRIAELEREVRNLRDGLEEAEAENIRLHKELNE